MTEIAPRRMWQIKLPPGVEPQAVLEFTQLLSAAGWLATFTPLGGAPRQVPLIAWGYAQTDGLLVPIYVDEAGEIAGVPEPYRLVFVGVGGVGAP